ncbi:hypothetical protein OIO90_006105 [Microbotryomycetes sp. JL221]|nr:hypothetical protein OIO90_006105 [Microbotryomycetes sp. JL221]
MSTETKVTVPDKASDVIADGSQALSGVLQHALDHRFQLKWQASGLLYNGIHLPESEQCKFEKQCWTLYLGPNSTHLDLKQRQRNEILSWPPSQSGQTYVYKWRYYLGSSCTSCFKFFHLMQLLSREQGGFVVALSFVNNKIRISSLLGMGEQHDGTARTQQQQQQQMQDLPQVDVDEFRGKTTFHRCVVKYGPHGFVDYTISSCDTNEPILSYRVSNVYVPSQTSLKTGLYRAHVVDSASACVGDFDFFQK